MDSIFNMTFTNPISSENSTPTNAPERTTVSFDNNQHVLVIGSSNIASYLEINNGVFNINSRTTQKSLRSYAVKDIARINVITHNRNIKISNNENNAFFSIESAETPKVENDILSVESYGDILLKISGNREYPIRLNLSSYNGDITTTENAKIQQGGVLQTTNGNILVDVDKQYIYLRNISSYNGSVIDNSTDSKTDGAPLKLESKNGNICINKS